METTEQWVRKESLTIADDRDMKYFKQWSTLYKYNKELLQQNNNLLSDISKNINKKDEIINFYAIFTSLK